MSGLARPISRRWANTEDLYPRTPLRTNRLAHLVRVHTRAGVLTFSLSFACALPTEQVTLLPQQDPLRAGDPMQLCRVDRRTIASSPSPLPWYLPTADAALRAADS